MRLLAEFSIESLTSASGDAWRYAARVLFLVPDDPNQQLDPLGYVCPKCNGVAHGPYRPFCGSCGCSLPSITTMQLIGLTIYPYRYGRPVRGLDAINVVIQDIGAAECWLERYYASWRTTHLRINCGDRRDHDFELVCTSTIRLELPIDNGWHGTLHVDQQSDGLIVVTDMPNDVFLTAGSVRLHAVERP